MIAIDLDGTLLSPDGTVSERARAAVHRCLAAGMLVCFATGRNWTESRTVLDAVAHYSTAEFAGGAMLNDTGQEVTLHRTMVDPQLAREVCAVLEGAGHAVLALQDTGTAGVDYLISQEIPLNPETERWMRLTRATVHRVQRLSEHPHDCTLRLGIVAAVEEVRQVKEELDGRFGKRLVMQNLFVPTARVDVLEIFDPAVNKWEGVLHVARHHGVGADEIIAIGDDSNDLPMLKSAGLGVAMGNARPDIQSAAKRVIGHNKDEGLAIFLEELLAEHAVEPMADEAAA
jgi:Cof subfamily protein (haloacid dehalogenase superfamily)